MTTTRASRRNGSGDAAPRKVTLRQVADLAGVSVATASKALNNQPKVNAQTRARVMAAASKLSYVPNAFAQSLLSGRSDSIGIITSDLQGRFSTPILVGAEDELGIMQNTVLLSNARGDALLERSHADYMLARNIDGLILVGDVTMPRAPLNLSVDIPIVYAYAPSTDPTDCSVTTDNVGAGKTAVEHLLSCGRRRIAFVGGDRNVSGNAAAKRFEGALQALQEAGLEPAGTVRFSTWSEDWGRAATRMLLDEGTEFDAVVCQCDALARGCLDTLRLRGLSVPDDVAIIGHDNWTYLTVNAPVPLTSIDNALEIIGHRAARAIIDAIDGNPHHGTEYVPCTLVQRASTIPLR